ncbi:unnamed protein product [Periconia digitata]|uniref:Uncharacterized protein n=1 Tax=Periconia digitata TaxID=1303443 RepID=A0A9W4UTH0_9PLEO|nr:unnamed protein product [Periconia digitata]
MAALISIPHTGEEEVEHVNNQHSAKGFKRKVLNWGGVTSETKKPIDLRRRRPRNIPWLFKDLQISNHFFNPFYRPYRAPCNCRQRHDPFPVFRPQGREQSSLLASTHIRILPQTS